jgi:hypothetical protein
MLAVHWWCAATTAATTVACMQLMLPTGVHCNLMHLLLLLAMSSC